MIVHIKLIDVIKCEKHDNQLRSLKMLCSTRDYRVIVRHTGDIKDDIHIKYIKDVDLWIMEYATIAGDLTGAVTFEDLVTALKNRGDNHV